jgi:hypothetical protein
MKRFRSEITQVFATPQAEADAIEWFLEQSATVRRMFRSNPNAAAQFKSDGYKMAVDLRLVSLRQVLSHRL